MAKDKLPKPTLTASPVLTAEERHKLIFDGWIDECCGIQEAFIEGLLVQIAAINGRST